MQSPNYILKYDIFWVCVFTVLLFLLTKGEQPALIDTIYTGSFVVLAIIPNCITLYILIPRYLKREFHFRFILGFIGMIVLGIIDIWWYYETVIDKLFPNYYFISYPGTGDLMLLFIVVSVLCVLVKLTEDWFYFNTNQNKKFKEEREALALKLETLRGQINPHFLFNALNVIYALALEKHEQTTNAVLQLSDILRYVLYESDVKQVYLKDEIRLLEHYIHFQQLRLEKPERVSLKTTITDEHFAVYPMLILPLVENSFKHGLHDDKGFVTIAIEQREDILLVSIANDYFALSEKTNPQHKGIGLETIKRNLDIVYPDVHEFTISKTETTFTVHLQLKALPKNA